MRPATTIIIFECLIVLALTCNTGCSQCAYGTCYYCYSTYMWDEIADDCVDSCPGGTIDYNAYSYGGYASCTYGSTFDSGPSQSQSLILAIVLPIVVILVIFVCICMTVIRRRRFRRFQSRSAGSPLPNNVSYGNHEQSPAINQVQLDTRYANYQQGQVLQGVGISPTYSTQGVISYGEPYGMQQPVSGNPQPVYGNPQPVYGNPQPVYGNPQPFKSNQQSTYGQLPYN